MSKVKSILHLVRKLFNNRIKSKKGNYSNYFNFPVRFVKNDWYVNERIIEEVFVHKYIDLRGEGKRILEFGCTESVIALQFASLGYEVVGIDLREYPLDHPSLTFYQGNILKFKDKTGFDYITAISTLEHIGLGAYGEQPDNKALNQVIEKLPKLLKTGGKLIVTVPVGYRSEDNFLRSFAPGEMLTLFTHSLRLIHRKFYCRKDFKFWRPCTLKEAENISNQKLARGPTGVNCVGCFVWRK